jgi:Rad3-related DNA helicase
MNNDVHILNYHYFLYAANYTEKFSDYDLVICDEADTLEQILTDFISFQISDSAMKRYGIHKPSKIDNKSQGVEEVWREWVKSSIAKIRKYPLDKLPGDRDSQEWKIAVKKQNSLLQSLAYLGSNINAQNWIFEADKYGVSFKPVWITPQMFDEYFGRHGEKFIFMSGSLPDEMTFCKTLGLYPADIDYFVLDSDFPVKNRPVYKMFSGSMGRKNQDATLPRIVKDLEKIFDKYPDYKILVHTVSYALQEKICELVKNKRILTHNSQNKLEKIDEFKKSRYPYIFLSPVCSRGVDLPDEQCRVNVILKTPFPYLGDKLTALRFYGNGEIGRRWYKSMACQEIIQMCGRGVRHKYDWCHTYVLDDDGCKLLSDKEMFKEWFLKGVSYG